MEELKRKMEELEKAKKACYFLLENENGLVDMLGLEYWAKRVERLRQDIKELI